MHNDMQKAAEVMRAGGVILYPTDTIWGIGCDATNSEAVQKVYEIKKRSDSKSMLVLLDDPNKLGRYIHEIPDMANEILDVNEDPLTIIYPQAVNLAKNLIASDGTIGIRITNDEFCTKLIRKLNKPLVSTSANTAGAVSPAFFDEISAGIIQSVDYVVEWRQDDHTKRKPSGIIKIGLGGEIDVLRG